MESFPGPHNSYMRPPLPPPPSTADPHHHQPPLPVPPQGPPPPSWYSPQFQYHHPSHSPSPPPQPPPPPHQQQWGPPPLPYPPHPYPNLYPPLQRPQMPPAPPPPYSNSNQDWGNANWGLHPGLEHQAHIKGEDWGAKARAWAAAQNARENQHPPMQSHYPSQCMTASDAHYYDSEQINMHSSSYQNCPVPPAPVDKQHMFHQPDPASVNSVRPYYAPDGTSYARKDGAFPDIASAIPQQDAFMISSVHKQEVPSSYSSIPGAQVFIEQQRKVSGSCDSVLADQSQFSYGNQSAAPSTDLCDRPLQFTSRFNYDNNRMMLASYSDPANPAKVMGSVTPVPTLPPWTPPAPANVSFPSAPPTFSSAAQLDPAISMPPLTGQPPPMFGRAPVPSFHSTVSSLSSPLGFGTGTLVHPATAFNGEMYGTLPLNPERPKKAAVPNWLRDEIIKNKDVIVSSGTEHLKEESEVIDDEAVDISVGKTDQADSKSIDSSRSTEEEEDVDYEEAVRTAAINQEIKRVLTEVLMKVTSELFDEIAMKVLSEDDNLVEASAKVSEKVLIPLQAEEPKSEEVSEKSSSGAAVGVLGLVNYASDDDDEIGSSVVLKSEKSSEVLSSNNKDVGEGMKNMAHSLPDSEKHYKNLTDVGNNHSVVSSRKTKHNHASEFDDLVDRRIERNGVGPPQPTNDMERKTGAINDHGGVMGFFDDSTGNSSCRKETKEPEAPTELGRKASKDDLREETRRHDRHENRSLSARCSAKEAEMIEAKENCKGKQIHGRHDERHRKNKEDYTRSKERSKEQGVKNGEKAKEDYKKRSPHRHNKEVERPKKASEKEYKHRRSEQSKDEKGERSKHKHTSDRGRHKRRRSSVDSKGRIIKDNSLASYSDNSADEASEKFRRKMHPKILNSSPSPVRSRRRQVSQSPPSSKASQCRHSPYSFEASRGRRSRSRSPAHRRR